MKFDLRTIPSPGSAPTRARPFIDVVVEGLDAAPHACLIDSGATAIRFGAEVAELCGVDLTDAPEMPLAVGGEIVDARMAEVALQLDDGGETYTWTAAAWFCEPWRPAFGLLGLTGFFDQFEVRINSYEETTELIPINV